MYETGNATSVIDLFTKLKVFMEANGWTTDDFDDEGIGKRFHAHRGSLYFNGRAYNVENPESAIQDGNGGNCSAIAFNIGSAYDSGDNWYDQAGVPVGDTGKYMTAGIDNITAAVPAYHFFAHNSGDQIIAVVEYLAGYYQLFGFGTLTKYGTYTGGEYMFGSKKGLSNTVSAFNAFLPLVGFFTPLSVSQHSPSFIAVNVDSETGFHWSRTYTAGRDNTRRYIFDNMDRFETTLQITPNTLNGLSVLSPIHCYIERSASPHNTSLRSPVGELPSVHFINMKTLVPGQQITYGSDDYRVFPFFHKKASADAISVTDGIGHSANYGFAVKEV